MGGGAEVVRRGSTLEVVLVGVCYLLVFVTLFGVAVAWVGGSIVLLVGSSVGVFVSSFLLDRVLGDGE